MGVATAPAISPGGAGGAAAPRAATGLDIKTPASSALPTATTTTAAAATGPVPVPSNAFEEQCKAAADAIKAAGAFLFSPGAGFSAESGVPTCRQINELDAYKQRSIEYPKLVSPFWIDDDLDLYYGFWGKTLNDSRNAAPHQGHALVKKWRDRYFGHATPTAEALRSAVATASAAAAAAAAALITPSKSNALAPTGSGNRASKRASRGITTMENAAELWAKHKAGQASPGSGAAAAGGAPPSPMNLKISTATGGADQKTPASPSTPTAAGGGGNSTSGSADGMDIHKSTATQVTPLGPFFWFTTNIDAGWYRAGFSPREVFEAHGNVERWQCIKPIKCKAAGVQCIPPPDFRFTINDSDCKALEKPRGSSSSGGDAFADSFVTNRPTCKCGSSSRPWVFQSGSDWAGNAERSRVFRAWLETVRKQIVEPSGTAPPGQSNPVPKPLVILEIGAGTRVTTLRYESHDLLNALPLGRCVLIRINAEDASVPETAVKPEYRPYVISIQSTALATCQMIDRFM